FRLGAPAGTRRPGARGARRAEILGLGQGRPRRCARRPDALDGPPATGEGPGGDSPPTLAPRPPRTGDPRGRLAGVAGPCTGPPERRAAQGGRGRSPPGRHLHPAGGQTLAVRARPTELSCRVLYNLRT